MEAAVKYVVQIEIAADVGKKAEENPQAMQEWLGAWQALDPLGMYFSFTRRAVTIIVDVPNEDAMVEAVHGTWLITEGYPEVWPVVDAGEFPAIMQRVGVG